MYMTLGFASVLFAVASVAEGTQPISTWLADSAISRGQGHGLAGSKPKISYEHGTFQRALTALYNATGNATYFNYIQSGIDNIISANGTVGGGYKLTNYILDDLKVGQSLIQLYAATNDSKYKAAADTFRLQIDSHPRNKAGGFWHKKTYPNEMWGDGQYMLNPFYAAYTATFQSTNTSAWSDIALQFNLFEQNARQNTTGLLYHGYDESKKAVWADNTTGHSPCVWDRAMGWFSMALVDVLDYFPQTHPGRAQLIGYLQSLAPALKAAADPKTGAWWLVISSPGRAGNYFESSGAAMYVFSLLKGIRKGYLDKTTFFPVAEKAYQYLNSTFIRKATNGTLLWEGTVIVGSLDGNGTFEYYISQSVDENDLKGISPMVLASVEYEQATKL
ncbi:glycosyl hydrolase, partial [Rickenella mellea]